MTGLILFAAAPRECGLRMFILMRPSSVPLIHIKAPGQLLGYWRLVRGCPNVNMGAEMRSTAVFAWLCLALLGGCDKPQPAAEIRPVRTVTAVAGSDGELVSLTGHIRAQKEQSLAFRIDGRMIKRHVEVGQVVRPNDLIAELDPVPQRDALHASPGQACRGGGDSPRSQQ